MDATARLETSSPVAFVANLRKVPETTHEVRIGSGQVGSERGGGRSGGAYLSGDSSVCLRDGR